ncbi:hypothetical protein OC861_003660 [Tilletia horrida]|nr:hypothetical protein OC861_003660 [Tilletia horrida]
MPHPSRRAPLDGEVELEDETDAGSNYDRIGGHRNGSPLKAPKKEKKDLDEDDLAFKAKQKADEAARKEAAAKLAGKKK